MLVTVLQTTFLNAFYNKKNSVILNKIALRFVQNLTYLTYIVLGSHKHLSTTCSYNGRGFWRHLARLSLCDLRGRQAWIRPCSQWSHLQLNGTCKYTKYPETALTFCNRTSHGNKLMSEIFKHSPITLIDPVFISCWYNLYKFDALMMAVILSYSWWHHDIGTLSTWTHMSLHKVAAILQTTFSNAFSWMTNFAFL